MTLRRHLLIPTLITWVLVAGCGAPAAVPVESVSGSGDPAGLWGTKGVEVTIVNDGRFITVKDRYNLGDSREMVRGDRQTWQGERNADDDVELLVEKFVELDFKNPSIGCPRVSTQSPGSLATLQWDSFCDEGGSKTYQIHWVWANSGSMIKNGTVRIVRESDSSDNKRFTVYVEKTKDFG
jgi:hypothetical protein